MPLAQHLIRTFRSIFPNHKQALLCNDRGVDLAAAGNLAEALSAFNQAVDANPRSKEAWSNLGSCFHELGLPEKACDAYQHAAGIGAPDARHLANWGNALMTLGDLSQAALKYQQALEVDPNLLEAEANLGQCRLFMGRAEEGFEHAHKAWSQRPGDTSLASMALFSSLHSTKMAGPELKAGHFRWPGAQQVQARNHVNNPDPDRVLKVGYVSSDFRTHSCACFVLPVFEAHDRRRVSVTAYNTSPKVDVISDRFRLASDQWVDAYALDDDELADQILADGVDILVDCSGHTKGHRLQVFQAKPAPVQVTWLGYPSTTGLTAIDYRLSDGFADPPGESDGLHSEQVVRLPQGYHSFRPLVHTPEPALPPVTKSGTITFGAFHNLAKLSPSSIQLWAEVLEAIPNSQLRIKARALSDPEVSALIFKSFRRAGVLSNRVQVSEWKSDYGRHYDDYADVDIALDATPYNGTTTTCEALWMGVPVITLQGERTASRVGASLLAQVDHSDWIAQSTQSYVHKAKLLASDVDELIRLRKALRHDVLNSALGNGARFTRTLEEAYRDMWHEWCDQNAEAESGL